MSANPASDMDTYIDALPSYRLREPVRPPVRYQTWNTPLLKPYNGFDGLERRRAAQLIYWLNDAGCLVKPSRCQICGSLHRVQFHSECYYLAMRPTAVCARCHRALHLRPWQWEAWRAIVEANSKTGKEWFVLAPRYGMDMAKHLRDQHGWEAARIERSPIQSLPVAISKVLPSNMMPHPKL